MGGGIQICVSEVTRGFTCLIIKLEAQLRQAWNAGICFQLEFSLFSVSMSMLLFCLLVHLFIRVHIEVKLYCICL